MTDLPVEPGRSPQRRILSRRALGLGLGGLGAGAWLARRLGSDDDDENDIGPSVVHGAHPLEPYRAPVFASGAPELAFLAVGDTGWPGATLESVAAAMERTARELPFSFVQLLGDNFYLEGVRSVSDPRWEENFERVFRGAHLDVPFHAALGNHDHNGNVQAQVEYSEKSSRWRMPGQYYSHVESLGGANAVEFFVLDTEALRRRERASEEQLVWFEQKLVDSRARWKIVVGHHPLRSNGNHGAIVRVRDAIEPLLVRERAALYLSGHDHDLELLETGKGFLQVVCGAGSSSRAMHWGADTLFAAAAPGFLWAGLGKDELWLVFIDAERGPLYSKRLTLGKLTDSAAPS
jgi:acid phosphatase